MPVLLPTNYVPLGVIPSADFDDAHARINALVVPVVGDNTGASDVSSTVAAIIAAGRSPYFGPGTWLMGDVSGANNLSAYGAGPGLTTIKQKAGSAYAFDSFGLTGWTVENLAVDGALGAAGHVPIAFRGGPTRCGVRNVKVSNTPGNMAVYFVNNDSPAAWSAATAYSVGNIVKLASRYYKCIVTRSATASPPDWDYAHWQIARYGNMVLDSEFEANLQAISVNNVTDMRIERTSVRYGTSTDVTIGNVNISDSPFARLVDVGSFYGFTHGILIGASNDCRLIRVDGSFNNQQNRNDVRGLTATGGSLRGIVTDSRFCWNGENGVLVDVNCPDWFFGHTVADDNWADNPWTDAGGSFAGSQQGGHGFEILSRGWLSYCWARRCRAGLWANIWVETKGCDFSNNLEHGYADAGTAYSYHESLRTNDNSQKIGFPGTLDGIDLGAAGGRATYITINGFETRNTGGGVTQRLGVNVASGCTGAVLRDGYAAGNVGVGASEQVYLSEPTAKVENIRGFVSEASGTGAVANGATTAVVTHGLAGTPPAAGIVLTPTNGLGSATRLWVSAISSTTFTVTADANPGASTAAFSWRATLTP